MNYFKTLSAADDGVKSFFTAFIPGAKYIINILESFIDIIYILQLDSIKLLNDYGGVGELMIEDSYISHV